MKKVLGAVAAVILALFGFATVLTGSGAEPSSASDSGGASLKSGVVPKKEWEKYVRAAGRMCKGVSAPLIAAQIETESTWNPRARNAGSGAAGLTQFIPSTWVAYGADGNGDGKKDPYEPADAIKAQATYMCALKQQLSGWLKAGKVKGDMVHLMLASYNAGPGAVLKFGGVPPYKETKGYIPKILAAAAKYTGSIGKGDGAPAPGKPVDCPAGGGRLVGLNHGRPWLKDKLIALGKQLQSQGWKVGEHPSFGGVNPVHGPGSLHDSGLAFDMNGPGETDGRADKLARKLWAQGYGVQWKVHNHYNHLHVDVGLLGGMFGGPQFKRNPNADKLGSCDKTTSSKKVHQASAAIRPNQTRPPVRTRAARPTPSRPHTARTRQTRNGPRIHLEGRNLT